MARGTEEAQLENFLQQPLSDGRLSKRSVPGLGSPELSALGRHDPPLDTTVKLMGLYFYYNAERAPFVEALTDLTISEENAGKIANAMERKSRNSVQQDSSKPLPKHEPPLGSGETTAVMQTFKKNPLPTRQFEQGMVPGIGNVQAGRLIEKDISTPTVLIGWFLMHERKPNMLKEFLNRCGCHMPSLMRKDRNFFDEMEQKADALKYESIQNGRSEQELQQQQGNHAEHVRGANNNLRDRHTPRTPRDGMTQHSQRGTPTTPTIKEGREPQGQRALQQQRQRKSKLPKRIILLVVVFFTVYFSLKYFNEYFVADKLQGMHRALNANTTIKR